jgi:hemerythrin-like metal-binding protein
MKPVPWTERFSVGIKEIDLQHRGLLDIKNQLIDSIEKENEWKTTSAILDSLINYAYNHFATEERYMKETEYPELSWHVGLHLEFIKKVFSLSQEVSLKGLEIQREMLTYLTEWYTNHVLGVDRKYMASLSAKGIK